MVGCSARTRQNGTKSFPRKINIYFRVSCSNRMLLFGFVSTKELCPCELMILYGLQATSDGSTHERLCWSHHKPAKHCIKIPVQKHIETWANVQVYLKFTSWHAIWANIGIAWIVFWAILWIRCKTGCCKWWTASNCRLTDVPFVCLRARLIA